MDHSKHGKRYPQSIRDRFVDLVCSAGMSPDAAAARLGLGSGTRARWVRDNVGMKVVEARKLGLAEIDGEQVGRGLTFAERVVIQTGKRNVWSQARIAREISRDRSVVKRELDRNVSFDGNYYAARAHLVARRRRARPRIPVLARSESRELATFIATSMDAGWSPKLISDMLTRGLGAKIGRVSHETIYRALYVQSRGLLRQDLHRQLSLGRSARKPRDGSRRQGGASPYAEAFSISERPAEAGDRAVPGHWEGDLIVGSASRSAIGTLVERSTRFTILLHLPGDHSAQTVAASRIQQMQHLPEHLRRSITWDRGTELAEYERIQTALVTKLYFADPRSPWQRGTNENTNRLLRHWFTKGTDLSVHDPDYLAQVAATLNDRPRPTLDYDTPAQRMAQLLVASTT